ncbi:mycothiol synthase [Cryobacterium algoritolerans]|uniref:mycothiol synthase n=1 Tax=Cryobacterium algoritolerans TaxID=1259184 RepID=UPI00141BE888|nr:mycothiol synthase [Cryobacterium algoritolerans]
MEFIRSGPDPADAAFTAELLGIAAEAEAADGYRPFNEQSLFDVSARRRTPLLLSDLGSYVGAVVTGRGELDLVVRPGARRLGHGAAALAALLPGVPGELTVWSHGDHPGAQALAARFGFIADRTLLQLRMPLPTGTGDVVDPADLDDSRAAATNIGHFRPGADDAEWVALNALVFANHPEQGALTLADLEARQSEPWFDAGDFLLARDRASGSMLGYNWLKIEPGEAVGEIYVIGVQPAAAGRGLGRRLMLAGLERLHSRGCTVAALYVEADSTAAVHLYRSLGFTDHTVDVQYRRDPR